ncbi:MAG TPA: phosphoribosylglycinamide formyltransferase [Bacteroidia bacterium]|nr:phosphoribosylglycinamide formyltransferase [Bacteroidia bacterium]
MSAIEKKFVIIFASGSGRNAENIIRYFQSSEDVDVGYVLTNNPQAGVILKTKNLGVPVKIFSRKEFYETDSILKFLQQENPSLIVLAGFLWIVPEKIIRAFPKKIINIHPALLPKFGGKGMFGVNVQKKVLESGDKESGITIHSVNEKYDAGDILFQTKCHIDSDETPESLTKKIHALENKYFPLVIESLLLNKKIESLHSE